MYVTCECKQIVCAIKSIKLSGVLPVGFLVGKGVGPATITSARQITNPFPFCFWILNLQGQSHLPLSEETVAAARAGEDLTSTACS